LQDKEPLPAPVTETRPPWEDAQPEGTAAQARDAIDLVAFVPGEPAGALAEALTEAAGISAAAQTMASAREAQAVRFTGWPLARIGRRRHDPVRELRETAAADALDSPAAGARSAALRDTPLDVPVAGFPAPAGARQSEVDNAITRFSDSAGGQLPASWKRSLRDAARSNAAQVPGALATAVREASAGPARVPGWWRLISVWQWLLIAVAIVAVGWSAVIAAGHGSSGQSALLADTSLIPWLLVTAAAVLVLGWLTASACQNMVLAAAEREQERAETQMRAKVETAARDLILTPAGHELAEYERFRAALAAAQAPLPSRH
jgi:hypothetical protein